MAAVYHRAMGWMRRLIDDDRIVFGLLALNAVGWVLGARVLLENWRDDAEIKPVQPKTQYITQETEDALKLSTLDTLLGHYNQSIRETSAKIVCDRAVNDKDTVDLLLWGITRKDYDERMRNLRALAIITDPRESPPLHPPAPLAVQLTTPQKRAWSVFTDGRRTRPLCAASSSPSTRSRRCSTTRTGTSTGCAR